VYSIHINGNYNITIFTVLINRSVLLLLGPSFALLLKISKLLFEFNSEFNCSLIEVMDCLFIAAPKLLFQEVYIIVTQIYKYLSYDPIFKMNVALCVLIWAQCRTISY
jgi:hypothetical protein